MSSGVKENLVSLETLMKKNLFTCAAHLPVTAQMNSCLFETAFFCSTRLPMKMNSCYLNSSLPSNRWYWSIISLHLHHAYLNIAQNI